MSGKFIVSFRHITFQSHPDRETKEPREAGRAL